MGLKTLHPSEYLTHEERVEKGDDDDKKKKAGAALLTMDAAKIASLFLSFRLLL